MRLKPLAGGGLLLTGSGIYWILSSQLIASFTVLMPELLRETATGTTLVLVTGIFASTVGLWMINVDLDELSALFFRKDGWMFTIPLLLVSMDVSLTIGGLAYGSGIVELNPFVSAAVQKGTGTLAAFLIAYMALSQGGALLAISAGRFLFGRGTGEFLPYSLVCGAASFGPLSNLVLLTGLGAAWSTLLAGALGAPLFGTWVYSRLRFSSADSALGSNLTVRRFSSNPSSSCIVKTGRGDSNRGNGDSADKGKNVSPTRRRLNSYAQRNSARQGATCPSYRNCVGPGQHGSHIYGENCELNA